MDLASEFARAVEENSGKRCLITEWGQRSYEEIGSLAAVVASELGSRGVNPGDKVILLLPNCETFVAALYGTFLRGCAAVPLNPLLRPPEVSYVLCDSGARAVLTVKALRDLAQGACARLDRPIEIVDLLDLWSVGGPVPRVPLSDARPEGVNSLGDDACILYTSGTTGRPKGVILTHGNLWSNVQSIWEILRFSEHTDDVFLSALPMFHSFELTVCVLASILFGLQVAVIREFKPAKVIEAMAREKGTIFLGVPPMYALLARTPAGAGTSSLCLAVSGGAALPVAVAHAFTARFGIPVHEGYGLSEAAPVCMVNPINEPPRVGSIGKPIPRVEARIVDEEGRPVPAGQTGELCIRGPNVMKGYLNLPEETQAAVRDGWLFTGDMARVDADGYYYIVDRKKEMINVGGENVYPREVEEVLCARPEVELAAVIGIPDRLRGEVPRAYLQLRQGATLTADEVLAHCRENLALFKVPKEVVFLPELPRGPTGKVAKRALKDLHST